MLLKYENINIGLRCKDSCENKEHTILKYQSI